MTGPTRAQIQAIVDTKIISLAVDSTKTMGRGVQAVYTAMLDVLYNEGTQTEQDILNLVLDNVVSGSLRGDAITGNGLTRYYAILNDAIFGDYPSQRGDLEDILYPYIRNVSRRTDVTVGQSLRDITSLILDKIYEVVPLPEALPVSNFTATVLSETSVELTWTN